MANIQFKNTIEVDGDVKIDGKIYDSSNAAGTSGQTLQSTGSGTAWTTSSGGTIDGSGTAGKLTKWLDTDTVEDSDYILEDTNHLRVLTDALTVTSATKRVGIGTTTATCTFHVNGDSRFKLKVHDGSNQAGTAGQIFSSTGTATQWIDAPSAGMTGFSISGNSGTPNSITDGETLAVLGSTGISTSVSANTVSILNSDRGSSQNIFKNIAVIGATTTTCSADTNNDTFSMVESVGLKIQADATTDTIAFYPQMSFMLTSHLDLSSSVSSSWYYIPFNGELESTTKAYQHSIVAPFDGYIRGISYKGAGTGTATTATTIKFRLMRNGTAVYTSGSLTLAAGTSSSKSVHMSLTASDTATFDRLMRLEIQIQVNQPIHKGLFSIILQEDT